MHCATAPQLIAPVRCLPAFAQRARRRAEAGGIVLPGRYRRVVVREASRGQMRFEVSAGKGWPPLPLSLVAVCLVDVEGGCAAAPSVVCVATGQGRGRSKGQGRRADEVTRLLS